MNFINTRWINACKQVENILGKLGIGARVKSGQWESYDAMHA